MAGSNTVQSVQRALDILERVAVSDDGARLSEIADSLGLKKPTAHNLIRTLQARGYLVNDPAHRFHVGPVIEDMSRKRYRRLIFQRADVEMRRLHAFFPHATLTFSELVGHEIVCRLRMAAELPGVLRRPQSQTFCPFGSASGLCLQAFNPSYRDSLAASGVFEESGHRLWANREAFEQAVQETAAIGLAVIASDAIGRLAAPVGDNHVLGASLNATEAVTDTVRERLRIAAAAIANGRDHNPDMI